MSSPGILMDEFARTPKRDELFSAIGRALAFSTRFEQNCRGLLILISVKEEPEKYLKESTTIDFIEGLQKRSLKRIISNIENSRNAICEHIAFADEILENARKARNEIAHEISSQLCDPLDYDIGHEETLLRLRLLCKQIAIADSLICIVLSILQNDPIPSDDFILKYKDLVSDWIFSSSTLFH